MAAQIAMEEEKETEEESDYARIQRELAQQIDLEEAVEQSKA